MFYNSPCPPQHCIKIPHFTVIISYSWSYAYKYIDLVVFVLSTNCQPNMNWDNTKQLKSSESCDGNINDENSQYEIWSAAFSTPKICQLIAWDTHIYGHLGKISKGL